MVTSDRHTVVENWCGTLLILIGLSSPPTFDDILSCFMKSDEILWGWECFVKL